MIFRGRNRFKCLCSYASAAHTILSSDYITTLYYNAMSEGIPATTRVAFKIKGVVKLTWPRSLGSVNVSDISVQTAWKIFQIGCSHDAR